MNSFIYLYLIFIFLLLVIFNNKIYFQFLSCFFHITKTTKKKESDNLSSQQMKKLELEMKKLELEIKLKNHKE